MSQSSTDRSSVNNETLSTQKEQYESQSENLRNQAFNLEQTNYATQDKKRRKRRSSSNDLNLIDCWHWSAKSQPIGEFRKNKVCTVICDVS